jgi:hypothetical protein
MDSGKLMRYMLHGDMKGAEGWEKITLENLPKTLEWIFSK